MTTNYYGAGYASIPSAWLALIFAGVSCLYLVAVNCGFHAGSGKSRSTSWLLLPMLGAFLSGGLLLLLPVILSPDIQSYIAASQQGAHYYTYPSTAFRPFPSAILFGPSWLAVASLLVSIGNHNSLLLIFLFRSVQLLAHLANTGLIWAILTVTAPGKRLPGTLLYAWNPLVLLELAGNGHYDGLVICLFLLATWLYVRSNHPSPVEVRAAEMSREGLYGRPPSESDEMPHAPRNTEQEQQDTTGGKDSAVQDQKGAAGDHKGPPNIRPTTLAPTEIGALLLVGLAISMDWLALVLAPLLLWFMARNQVRGLSAFKGFCLRALPVLAVVTVTYLPVWQGGTTFLGIISSIDLQQMANSPLLLLAAPLRPLFTQFINWTHIPSYPAMPVLPVPAADLTVITTALVVFVLLYFYEASRMQTLESLFTGMCIVMLGFVLLASAIFWPWYITWLVWITALRPYDTLSKTLLLLSCTALLYYPLQFLDVTPLALLVPLCIFGIPFVYFVGMRFIASLLASRSTGRTR